MTIVHVIFEMYCSASYFGQCEGELSFDAVPAPADMVDLMLEGELSLKGMLTVEYRTFHADKRGLGYGVSLALNDLHFEDIGTATSLSLALQAQRGLRFWPASLDAPT
jgi:hypothetical protein